MSFLADNFRRWWQIPRRAGERQDHRHVTFLELFYDLVYVVIIAELAHSLATHLTWTGVGNFVFLFIMVWWAWLNGSMYHDLHGRNDLKTRIFTFLQMIAVVGMAIFAHNAVGEGSIGFALSFAGFQAILTFLWWRTGVHDSDHRPLSYPYSLMFVVTTMLFAGSIFVDESLRYILWGLAVIISLLLPITIMGLRSRNEITKAHVHSLSHVNPSLVERFGLFNIIVLGEIVVGVVSGVTHLDFTIGIGIHALLGTLIAIGAWWIYFDFVSHRIPKHGVARSTMWYYLHLPLTMSIAAVGAAVLVIIEHADGHVPTEAQWLLLGSLAIIFISTALLIRLVTHEKNANYTKTGGRVMLACAVLIILLGTIALDGIPLLFAALILLLAPVAAGFILWVRDMER